MVQVAKCGLRCELIKAVYEGLLRLCLPCMRNIVHVIIHVRHYETTLFWWGKHKTGDRERYLRTFWESVVKRDPALCRPSCSIVQQVSFHDSHIWQEDKGARVYPFSFFLCPSFINLALFHFKSGHHFIVISFYTLYTLNNNNNVTPPSLNVTDERHVRIMITGHCEILHESLDPWFIYDF